ncbi:MaoC family dehydratase [Sphingobium sp. AN641]|uniref:MaoC family dehydratase n=1 Tax=Sphingobium sp. AN641 TaxID=3133443 RepID=UPI0030C4332F
MSNAILEKAALWKKGHLYEDFFVGQTFQHHWGRTISESDNMLFSTLTLSFVPLYFNRAYAMQQGHPDIVLNPQLIFNVALGLSVEDCSEIGGPFLGVYDLRYHRPAYPGVTLIASSTTVEARISGNNPAVGIVTWETEGRDENGDLLVSFRRSNQVRRREGASQ